MFIDDLIAMFRKEGWEVVDAPSAFEDPIYRSAPAFAGESLIYDLAKDAQRFEHLLRYPAEDGRYEKQEMDWLGL